MDTSRAFTYLKSEIRSVARLNGEVSAADVRNVMRTYFEGSTRGATVSNAFRSLIREGFLRPTNRTERNPDNRHDVKVYRLSW